MLSCLSAMEIASRQEAAQFARSIKSEGERMGRLIDDMLTLSNADNANFPVHPKDTELDTLLLSVYEKFEPLAHTRKIALSVSLPGEDLPLCRCDGERISQVLSILVDNALSYTPQGGKVALSLSYTGSRFQLAVRDTGMGFPTRKKAPFLNASTDVTRHIRTRNISGLDFALQKKSCGFTREP